MKDLSIFPNFDDRRYGRILQKMELQPNDLRHRQLLRIFKWLTVVARPVKVSEVESWLMITPGSSVQSERSVISHCGSLLEILPDSTIQFVHFSVKE